MRDNQIGAVVVRLRFDESGHYSGADAPAFVGDEEFSDHVARIAATWQFTAAVEHGCVTPRVFFMPFAFRFRD